MIQYADASPLTPPGLSPQTPPDRSRSPALADNDRFLDGHRLEPVLRELQELRPG